MGRLLAPAQVQFREKSKEWLKTEKEQRGKIQLNSSTQLVIKFHPNFHQMSSNFSFLSYISFYRRTFHCFCSRATSMERLSSSSSTLSSRSPGHKLCIYVNSGWAFCCLLFETLNSGWSFCCLSFNLFCQQIISLQSEILTSLALQWQV